MSPALSNDPGNLIIICLLPFSNQGLAECPIECKTLVMGRMRYSNDRFNQGKTPNSPGHSQKAEGDVSVPA